MESELVVYTRSVSKRFEPISQAIVSDMDNATVKVEWQPWRLNQSQYHWRGREIL